jgi:hypothetical protein
MYNPGLAVQSFASLSESSLLLTEGTSSFLDFVHMETVMKIPSHLKDHWHSIVFLHIPCFCNSQYHCFQLIPIVLSAELSYKI